MAENKKSFVLYSDQKGLFDKLPDNKAGKLIKHIFSYVNDEHPESDDLIIEIAFESIKTQLKRDLKKWEKEKESKSDAGVIGNLKRWHPDLYKQYLKDKSSLSELLSVAKNRKASQSDKKIAVNVNVNDNVSVNVNDNKTKLINDFFEDLKNEYSWLDLIKKATSQLNNKKIFAYLKLWLTEQAEIDDPDDGGLDRSISKIKLHFKRVVTNKPDLVINMSSPKEIVDTEEKKLSEKEKLELSCKSIIHWWNDFVKSEGKLKTRLPYHSYDTLYRLKIISISESDHKKYIDLAEGFVIADFKKKKIDIPSGLIKKNDKYAIYRTIPEFNSQVKNKAKSIGLYYWMENKRLSGFDLEKLIKDTNNFKFIQ